MERKRPNHAYCEVCQGPINYPQMWTLTGNMSRVHENQDHCIRNLHLRHGMMVNVGTGRRIRIPKSMKIISPRWKNSRTSGTCDCDKSTENKDTKMPNGLRIFSGSANGALAAAICSELGTTLGVLNRKQFADKELWVEFGENIRGVDVFLVQPTCFPADDNIMELMLMIDAAKRASADRITAVIPYYGYARQDRKDRPRVPISAKTIAVMLEAVGVDRILAMDLHNAAEGGFFEIPVDHLYALPVFIDYIKDKFNLRNLTVVSPDVGGVTRARLLASKLNVPLAIIDKQREAANVSEVMNVIGDVTGRDCLLVDDMIDTAGTLCKGAVVLMKNGAKSASAVATHGVFSYDHKADIHVIDKIEDSPLQEVLVADTIDQTHNLKKVLRGDDKISASTKLKALSVAPLFATAIKAIHSNESVSGLFV